MKQSKKVSLKRRVLFTALVTSLYWGNLIWDYLHQGVPSHYLLHRKDFPEISNWWGGIVVPIFTWFMLYRIAKRVNKDKTRQNTLFKTIYNLLGSLSFGIVLSFLFAAGSSIPDYMMVGAILISFFVPLYKAEFLLGYVLGMSYAFGGVISIASGVILLVIFIIMYLLIRKSIVYLISKSRHLF